MIDSSACGGIEIPLSADTGPAVFVFDGVKVIVTSKSFWDDGDMGSRHQESVGELSGR